MNKLLEIVREYQKTGKLITLRELARKLRISQKEALELCEDAGLNINVAIGVLGGGSTNLKMGDYTIEDLGIY